MKTHRIFLHPGYIKSKNDNDVYYINAWKLARLYKVPLPKCIIVNNEDSLRGYRSKPNDVHLYPDYYGKYDINERIN